MNPLLTSLLASGLAATCLVACGSQSDTRVSRSGTASTPTPQPTTGSKLGSQTSKSSQTAIAAGLRTATVPTAAPQRPHIKDTYDEDDSARRAVEENDDREIEIYGRPATVPEWRAAADFARAYFRAAAAEDGATACTLLTPMLQHDLGGSYEHPSDPPYLHGKTCAEVLTKLFKHRHKLMTAETAGLEVTDVRVTPRTAFILLAFKGIRERRFMGVERYGNTWKLEALTDSQYP